MNAVVTNFPPVLELRLGDAGYPPAIGKFYGVKTPALSLMGNTDLLCMPGVGFCGSRKASPKGIETAVDCAEQAVESGFVVISGNAAGVDFAAHHAALQAGGTTILVLPEGIDHFRIRRELRLVWDWGRALVVSQFGSAERWQAYRAMSRNEVIIALSAAMVVIEAGTSGGTWAAGISTLKAKKPLFVAVYEHTSEAAEGNSLLIEQGGIRLARSRATGRANFEKIRVATEQATASPVGAGSRDQQLSLL